MQLLNNRYLLQKVLGQGGMGRVYLALDQQTNKRVAVKECFSCQNKKDIRRIKREYYFMKKVDHPHIVKGIDFFEIANRYFIVMEYIEGITLRKLIELHPPNVDFDQQLRIAQQICSAVATLNECDVIHRDLKPENIMLIGEKYHPMLLDLGIAKITNKELTTLTKSDAIVGTAAYLSPEQVDGKVKFNSDVFSLGVILYQFFSWQKTSPFYSENTLNILMNVAQKPLPTLFSIIHSDNPHFYKLSLILDRATQKKSRLRTSSATQLWKELKNIKRNKLTIYARYFALQLYHYKWLCILLIGVSVAIVRGITDNYRQQANSYISKAQHFYGIGEYSKAIDFYNKVIDLGREDHTIYTRRGGNYHALQKYHEAIADYNKAMELSSRSSALHNLRGLSYHKLQMYDKAIADFSHAIKSEPKMAEAHNNRGLCYYSLQNYVKAVENFLRAAQLKPQLNSAQENLVAGYLMLKDFHKAITHANNSIKLTPYSATAYNNRAEAYAHLLKYDKAIADYTKAIALSPQATPSYYGRGRCYFEQKHSQKALQDLTLAIQYQPDYESAYFLRGRVFVSLRKYKEAIADFSKLIKLQPQQGQAYHELALVHYHIKNYRKALENFDECIRLQPRAEVYGNRGMVHNQLQNYQQALDDWEKAIELNPKYRPLIQPNIIMLKNRLRKK
ncbi:serine/threonine-protein kinase [Candidatus Uabimicrobium amorphum]|nr:serine/threonine-protein kinase [Candidatus Uabimicrobium amorphum]